ncbi:DUF4175 family protein [Limibacter armeniacum]|uniref:DUF4175 family protein n=1 Tax=Limibacter armeniacum TaxID=466084 RepID=UPI002FE6729E
MLENKIKRYKQKYYRNAIIKGSIFALTVILSTFLLVNALEYLGSFNKLTRAILFFSFIAIISISFYHWVFLPLSKLFFENRQISDQDAAKQIGKSFPTVADKLLNTLQISQSNQDSDLVKASIQQKASVFNQIDFTEAIQYKENNHYLKFLAIPAFLIITVLALEPQVFTESTPKIINYKKEYIPQAPFQFNLQNKDLTAFRNDNFTLELKLTGRALPNDVYIETEDGRKLKMTAGKEGSTFKYEFKKIQKGMKFQFASAGYFSSDYNLKVIQRPSLSNFNIRLEYPKYINKADETVSNTGNLMVPEGTKVSWQFNTQMAENLHIKFESDSTGIDATKVSDALFEYQKVAKESSNYKVILKNDFSTNKDNIEYFLNVIPDKFPSISLRQFEDTVMYNYLLVGGNIGDDYGVTALKLRYRIHDSGSKSKGQFKAINIPFNKKAINQSYFYRLNISDFKLNQGQRLEYFVEVWDNDAVNGRKRSKTNNFEFKLPSKEELKNELAKETKNTKSNLDKTLQKSQQLEKDLENIQDKLKGRKQLTWQDKKDIEQLIEKKKELENEIKQLQEQYKITNEKSEKFNDQNKEELSDKAAQLQKLMDELLDEETKKLYDELNKLLEQNYINQNLQENLDNIQQKQKNLKNELDRALELFKKLKVEQKANEIVDELKELSKDQEKLAQETEKEDNSNNNKDATEQLKEQEELNKKFEDIKKEMDDLKKMNEELDNSNQDYEQFDSDQKQIEQDQQNAQQQLEQQQKKQASQSQKKAADKMQQMAQQMEQQMQSSQMQQMSENYDDLRQIMDNLIKLSFDQEQLMKDFKSVKRIDPKFVDLSQDQLKLKDDAKYIEDSLISLSKRVFQIQSFVTREVTEMNKYMDESLDAIRKRIPEIASSKQQFAMTSINNLALLLNDILDQMQMQMSQSMSGKQNNQQKQNTPSMSELQKQLNQQIQELKKSGKSGRQLSEELAKLAAQQEMIRNAMKQQMGKGKEQMKGKEGKESGGKEGEGGEPYKQMLEEMEKTEEDLVNKKLTDELIKRQREILTRLLESEKAAKEKELDEERKGEIAEQQKKSTPPNNFDEYLKKKELQIELLRTIPTSLNQYYKQEVNKYFEKIKK